MLLAVSQSPAGTLGWEELRVTRSTHTLISGALTQPSMPAGSEARKLFLQQKWVRWQIHPAPLDHPFRSPVSLLISFHFAHLWLDMASPLPTHLPSPSKKCPLASPHPSPLAISLSEHDRSFGLHDAQPSPTTSTFTHSNH